METLKTMLFNSEDKNNPVLYLRYVDDIFCIFRKDVSFNNFHQKLNKDKSIQYIGLISRPLIERTKEHKRRKADVSDYITNCNKCLNEELTFNNFKRMYK